MIPTLDKVAKGLRDLKDPSAHQRSALDQINAAMLNLEQHDEIVKRNAAKPKPEKPANG